MTREEVEKVVEEENYMEYLGNCYEVIGVVGEHYLFSDLSNGDVLSFRYKELLKENFYYVDKEQDNKERKEYLRTYYNINL